MDLKLVERARSGDVDAFSAIVEGRLPRAFQVASLIVRDEALAADAVQEAMLAAWRDLPTLRDPGRFDAWFNRILVRSCQRAAAGRRATAVVELLVDVDLVEQHEGAMDVVVRDQLERGFERLPVDQRAVVVLRHYLGLSIEETAAALGIPTGTVLSRVNRGLAALRAALEADERMPSIASEATR
jgi:RNA polymerase sigma-70 factor (ECF subfamily)